VKKYQNAKKKMSDDKKRLELGNEGIKKYQNAKKIKSNDKKRMELGNEGLKKHQIEINE
jgi:hypothetical protein